MVVGDRHTQDASFEMHRYAAKAMRDPALNNPTIVLLTDRNGLDDQLFDEVFMPSVDVDSSRRTPRLSRARTCAAWETFRRRDRVHGYQQVRDRPRGRGSDALLSDRNNIMWLPMKAPA